MSTSVIHEVRFGEVTPDDIAAWFRFDALMSQEAPLSPFQLGRASLNSLPPLVQVRLFVGRDAVGEITAEARIVMGRDPDHRHCHVHIAVHPQWRQKGLARSMLTLLLEVAEANNRTIMVGWTTDRVEAGTQFVKTFDAAPIDELILHRLESAEANRPLIRQWLDSGAASCGDYRMLAIDGPYPERILPAIFDLRSGARTIKSDDLLHELPATTLEGLRELESWWPAERRRWSVVVHPRGSEEVAGFTELSFRGSRPVSVFQAGTIVHPAHRRIGIAKWLKATLLHKVFSELPSVQEVHTGNASWNHPIMDMNRALGFQRMGATTAWQVDVERARDSILKSENKQTDTEMVKEF